MSLLLLFNQPAGGTTTISAWYVLARRYDMIQARKQSTTAYPVTFFMLSSSDHVTGKIGLAPTVTISKNGGAFGSAVGAVTEIANGWYALAGNASDRDTLGSLTIHATGAGADACDISLQIVSYDPFVFLSLGTGGALSLIYTLTNSATGSPIEGAIIECYSDAGMTSIVDSKVSNAFGQVTFSNLVAGTYYLKITKPGYVATTDSKAVS